MKKYIKAEDVKDLLIGLDSLPWEEEVDDIIEQLKTANVKEVVHAKWERKYDIDKGIYWHECSNCGCKPPKESMESRI